MYSADLFYTKLLDAVPIDTVNKAVECLNPSDKKVFKSHNNCGLICTICKQPVDAYVDFPNCNHKACIGCMNVLKRFSADNLSVIKFVFVQKVSL